MNEPHYERIRRLRIERGWTVEELARRAHLTPLQVQNWEHVAATPPVRHFAALARALETTMDALWWGDE